MNDTFIDSVAAFGKLGIEASGRTRDEKELAKSKVDCVSAILKLMQIHPEQNLTVMGIGIEKIKQVKEFARQCSVEKVVLFPYLDGQSVIPLIRIYGGNKELFFKYNGWTPLQPSIYSKSNVFDSLEKEFGIILYTKD